MSRSVAGGGMGWGERMMFSFSLSYTHSQINTYTFMLSSSSPSLKRIKSYHPFLFGILTPDTKSYIQFLSADELSQYSLSCYSTFNFWNVSYLCLSQISMCVVFNSVHLVCGMRKYMFLINSVTILNSCLVFPCPAMVKL